MASITIRNLDDEVEKRLRIRATRNYRSIEEARQILTQAVRIEAHQPRILATFSRECFERVGFVEVEQQVRRPMREPPNFS